jgi:hypothetical protein
MFFFFLTGLLFWIAVTVGLLGYGALEMWAASMPEEPNLH